MVYHRSEGSGSGSGSSSRLDRIRSTPSSSSQPAARNAFRNDGSFLEMFKKMQEAKSSDTSDVLRSQSEVVIKTEVPDTDSVASGSSESRGLSGPEAPVTTFGSASSSTASVPKKPQPFVGKRRGGRVLPTGVVKKRKTEEDEEEDKPKDAWSLYMAEVRRYKETSCEEDGKTRPLVK